MMKFITEEYLRNLYRKEPFDTYKLEQGQRFTPGAMQYLSDKRIKTTNDNTNVKNNTPIVKKSEEIKENDLSNDKEINIEKEKLCYKLKHIESEFLIFSSEIIKEDIFLAQNIVLLKRSIANIRNTINGKSKLEKVLCKECEGIKLINFSENLDECFEINEFHLQLKNSSIILKINNLRCLLQEIKYEIYESLKNDRSLQEEVINNIHSIINTLSQLICAAVGGKVCQKKEQISKDAIT